MTFCPNCGCSLTSTDFEAGYCTNCNHELTTKETTAMTSTLIKTSQGKEATVSRWTCPGCKHVQDDTVHPELGPYISVTCGNCTQSFSDEDLSAEDLAKWNEARDLAESLSVTR